MFSQKQLEIFKFPYEKEYDLLICDGAIRSGKSVACILSFVLWAMSNFNQTMFGICSKTIKACERNIIKPLQKIAYWEENQFKLYYSSVNTLLTISRGKKVNYFYVFGGRDESSQDLVQGITLAGVLLDEVALMPKSFVSQVTARCSVDGSKVFFNCNPANPEHWFKKEFIDKQESKKAKYLHFTMEDNPSLSAEKKAQYKRMYEGVFYKRYILGQWCSAEGVIYKRFADNNERYIINSVDKESLWRINVGLDFGNNASSHTIVATGITYQFKEVIPLMELKISESIDANRLASEFISFIDTLYNTYKIPFVVRCDSAETTLINSLRAETIKQNRYFCNVTMARKSAINERIALTSSLIAQERFKILNTCEHLITALNSATWDEKHPEQRLDLVGHNNPVDMLDAFEYSIEEFSNELLYY